MWWSHIHLIVRAPNGRPIIGILAQDIQDDLTGSLANVPYTSYISASYVKFVESGGARVVPILINQPDEYYEMIFQSINGMMIPGGVASFDNSGKSNNAIANKSIAFPTYVQ